MTRAELVERAADKKKVAAVGQSLSPEDREKIDGHIDPLLAELTANHIVYVSDSNDIPDAFVDALAELMAERMTEFGGARDPAKKKFFEDQLETMYRRQNLPDRTLVVDSALQVTPSGYSQARWTRGV